MNRPSQLGGRGHPVSGSARGRLHGVTYPTDRRLAGARFERVARSLSRARLVVSGVFAVNECHRWVGTPVTSRTQLSLLAGKGDHAKRSVQLGLQALH